MQAAAEADFDDQSLKSLDRLAHRAAEGHQDPIPCSCPSPRLTSAPGKLQNEPIAAADLAWQEVA